MIVIDLFLAISFAVAYQFDAFRFTYFSRASLDYIVKSGKQPDVLHIHNWETSIVGPLFWDIFVKQVQFENCFYLVMLNNLSTCLISHFQYSLFFVFFFFFLSSH
jgi:glycogen synthase